MNPDCDLNMETELFLMQLPLWVEENEREKMQIPESA